MAPYIVLIVRLLVPFSILRWPLGGTIASIIADASDSVIYTHFGWGVLRQKDYQFIDKYFDLYYLSFEAFIVLRWQELFERRSAIILFLWRFFGILAFEVTKIEPILFFAPNIFENFYLLVLISRKLNSKFKIDNWQMLSAALFVAGFPKIIQEYIMHYVQYPLGLGSFWTYLVSKG